MDYDIIGAVKIKDGLFLGDEYAAQVEWDWTKQTYWFSLNACLGDWWDKIYIDILLRYFRERRCKIMIFILFVFLKPW